MSDDWKPPIVEPVGFERLEIDGDVRISRLVVVDDARVARARIAADSGGHCSPVLLHEDRERRSVPSPDPSPGRSPRFERISPRALDQVGAIEVAARARNGRASRVELVAHDPAGGDGCVVGLHLFDRGDEVAGFHVFEERQADAWTDPS